MRLITSLCGGVFRIFIMMTGEKGKGKKGVVERNINDIVDRWIRRGIGVGGVKGCWCK